MDNRVEGNVQLALSWPVEERSPNEDDYYISNGIEAEGHTLVYKMHKYFARRPQNVFQWLIETYSRPNEIILDCFCGGGVSLFEGLSIGRKVIAVDINPLATFISDCQTTKVSIEHYKSLMEEIRDRVYGFTRTFFTTTCRECSLPVDVRWFELAYLVDCKECNRQTVLSHERKRVRVDKVINGVYRCEHCENVISAAESPRRGYRLLSVTYKCKECRTQLKTPPNNNDHKAFQTAEDSFDSIIKNHDLWYPKEEIPAEWDRQKEDGLLKKGIKTFSDLFTKRLLLSNAYYLKVVRSYKDHVPTDMYKMLIFTFSATIRHTNNMTISTEGWMGGRPVSWAKHAYWIPNQFVEVNPIEYIEKRTKAVTWGLRYQKQRLGGVKRVNTYDELHHKDGTHIVWSRSSAHLPLPDASIDLVITDPPYGSNVQYGELSSFWLVWLKDEVPRSSNPTKEEVLVHRRTKRLEDHKGYGQYFSGLLEVFKECHRVLKAERPLVFTFNNKDVKAWYSVISAAVKAGFYLDERGVIYQEPIENYKNTAHTRFPGSLHGDFIYTFIKRGPLTNKPARSYSEISEVGDISNRARTVIGQLLKQRGSCTINEVYIEVYSKLIPHFVSIAESDKDFESINETWDIMNVEQLLRKNFCFDEESKTWHCLKEPTVQY
jgi:putative DNA methylase